MNQLPFSQRSISTELLPLSKRAQGQDPVRMTATSILKIINFLLFRVPDKNKAKYLARLRGKIMRLPSGQIGMKQMPQSASIGQSIALVKNILSGLNPFFIQRVVNELANLMAAQTPERKRLPIPQQPHITQQPPIPPPTANMAFPFSKRAIQVVIEPLDPIIQQAVAKINAKYPKLLEQVHKIVVHPFGGPELGHVQSGPNKDPQEIHLFKGAISELVRQQLGLNYSQNDYAEALERAIVSVIGHESGHIGETPKTPEQMRSRPFAGEQEAESKSKETIKRMFPNESVEQDLLEPTPGDISFLPSNTQSYDSDASTIVSPISIRSIPVGTVGTGR